MTITLGGVKREITDLPTGVLIGFLYRWFGKADEQREMVRELRRRGNDRDASGQWFGKTLARMNQIDPPPCRCGRPGLYIVGRDTYCRKCKCLADVHRAGYSTQLDEYAADMERATADFEQRRLTRERKHRALGGRHRPKA